MGEQCIVVENHGTFPLVYRCLGNIGTLEDYLSLIDFEETGDQLERRTLSTT